MKGRSMTPEAKAREIIDQKLRDAGWILQDLKQFNPLASCGVAVREFPGNSLQGHGHPIYQRRVDC